jgi:chromosome segregation ATPase
MTVLPQSGKQKRVFAGITALLITAVGSLASPDLREFFLVALREYGLAGLVIGLAIAGLVHNFRQAEIERERSEANARRAQAAEQRSNEVEDRLTALLETTVDTLKAEAAAEKLRASARITALSTELDETKARLEKFATDLRETKALYQAERRYSANLESANKALQQINDKLTVENREFAAKLPQMEGRIKQLEAEVVRLSSEVKSREDKISELLKAREDEASAARQVSDEVKHDTQ